MQDQSPRVARGPHSVAPHRGVSFIRAHAASLLLTSAFVGLFAACGDREAPTDIPNNSDGSPLQISVNVPSATIAVGENVQLSALNASGPVTWTSGNATVATVSPLGFVTGVAPGTTTITAADSKHSASATLTVQRPPAIILSPMSLAFSAKAGGIDPFNQLVDIANGSDASFSDVTVTGVTYGAGQPTDWIRTQVLGSVLPARLAVRAVTGGLPVGVYTATIAVAPFDALDRPQNVLITFTVSAP